MATCFVIQPFDSGKYDKRFQDIYKPAIEAAGLEAYRVDRDPGVMVPIEAIEKGIRQAALCLADISADNPNVWYELGYAFASDRPVIMVCSEERPGKKYPFDIQHRSIIPYMADSPSDFDKLRDSLTAKLKTISERSDVLDKIADSDPVVPIQGLTPIETLVLAVVAGEVFMPDNAMAVYDAKRDAESRGITNMGFNLALRKLAAKSFVRLADVYDENNDRSYSGISLTDQGWKWIEANESRFVLHRPEKKNQDDIPF
jgi:hypothetical protein